ncbi:MAG TPA: BTAD domain-containing putative transcriptional regulator [Gaiella sp.]|nr:BTAD domain-containing putative transcriptional regulator [Gaiella sp.]
MGEIRVLGPVEIVGDDGPVRLAAKHRRLVAALLVANGRACSVDELVEAVWNGSAPNSARKLVQVYVSQLRRKLPESLEVVTRGDGYALELAAGQLDAARFERLLREVEQARQGGNASLAASLVDQALALWRGHAYGELAYEDIASMESERLEELRLVALERRVDAHLALGRHADVLAEALALAEANPFREPVHELAMLALYRSGRQTDALDHYASFRARLGEELGLEPGPALRELQRRILQHDPALAIDFGSTRDGAALPASPTPLVGRDRELEDLRGLLSRRDARLLVLTGAGGSGKTRLALEVARQVASTFANGAVLVELAPLRDPGLVVPTIARALGVADEPARDAVEGVAAALATQELLLVLDNAEHLRLAAPSYAELVKRAPRLTLLVTSRAVLHVTGERVYPVAPLDEAAAVELFEQRAKARLPDFVLTEQNEAQVREICRKVDCLPLAVELAAARMRVLTPEAVLERLNERLSLLAGGPRDVPARQQTLRETLNWSYDLLSDDERGLLARLAVFRGGATLPAIAAVCLDGDETLALDLVERLADASLLLVLPSDGDPRYGLLETVREYAAERLLELGADEPCRRHAEWVLALAERAEPELSGELQTRWFSVLELENDNARSALVFFLQEGDVERALRLTVALSRFWYVHGHLGEGRRHVEAVLPYATDQDPLLLRRAQTAGASIALLQGDYTASTAFAEGALDSARRAGEPRFVANALSNLGAIVLAAGDHERAARVLEQAVSLAREVGDTRIAALAINNLGDLALTTGDYERARPLFEESHALLRARGDTANLARSLFNLGAVDLMLDDRAAATARFREGLALASDTGDKEDLAWCLEGLAAVAAREGAGERASVLLGAAVGLLLQMGADFKPFERQLHESTRTRAEALCGSSRHVEARERGAAMPIEDALTLALDARAAPRSGAG